MKEIWRIFRTFFALVGAIIFLCTICDIVKRSELVNINGTVDTLAKFSLYTNALSILSTKKTSGLMPALQGMRFICMCWVVLGHRYFTSMYRPLVNQVDIISVSILNIFAIGCSPTQVTLRLKN